MLLVPLYVTETCAQVGTACDQHVRTPQLARKQPPCQDPRLARTERDARAEREEEDANERPERGERPDRAERRERPERTEQDVVRKLQAELEEHRIAAEASEAEISTLQVSVCVCAFACACACV